MRKKKNRRKRSAIAKCHSGENRASISEPSFFPAKAADTADFCVPLPCRLGLSGQAATPIPASVTYAGKPPALPFSWSSDYCEGLRILLQGFLLSTTPLPGSPLSPVLRIPNPSYHRNNCTRNAIGAEQILGHSSFGRPVHESHTVAAISPLQAPLKQECVLPA